VPSRVALPFQTVETVNESAQDRQRAFAFGPGFREEAWRNRLIWGDKKYVLPSLLAEFAGKVNLIYIDPPFDTGADFSFTATVPTHPESEEDGSFSFTKEPSIIEQKAYRDTWGSGLDSYLHWFYETIVLLHQLLHETGSIYVHLDVHRGPYAKLILDEVFGVDNFQNEIAWYYYNKLHGASKRCFHKAFDQILYYAKNKSANYCFRTLTEPREQPVKKLKYQFIQGKIKNLKDESGKAITYISTERQIDNVWRIRCLQPANEKEWVGYDTQKPVDLIERILSASTNEGDLVLDCFCGSGSSLLAAEGMNRRWIACDLGRFAVHTTRKRLLSLPNVKPFVVQNLGKYERQQWAGAEFGDAGDSARRRARGRTPGGQALVAVDRLLGGGLGQQERHIPQRVADLPDAQGQDARARNHARVRRAGRLHDRRQGDRHSRQRHNEDNESHHQLSGSYPPLRNAGEGDRAVARWRGYESADKNGGKRAAASP
jgi:DNA modification methylase